MSIEETLNHRKAVGVLVRLNSTSAKDLSSLAPLFDDEAGSRGALLSAYAARARSRSSPAPQMLVFEKLGIAYGAITRDALDALRNHPAVESVKEANSLRMIRPIPYLAATEPAKPDSGPTWGVRALKADALWAQGLTGKGVLIGHLDTGIDGTHPMLESAIEKAVIFDVGGRERKAASPPEDSGEHGTHTAGTIVGRAVKRVQAGMAPGAKLLSAEVIEGGDGIARVLGGMNWALLNGAKILNMSLGWPNYVDSFLMVMDALRANECLPVVAVGNEGQGSTRSPGNYAQALSVGAFSENGRIPDFSGSEIMKRDVESVVPDIVAPGDDVWSAAVGGGFKVMRGTSMATPHISGLAALLMEAHPNATIVQVEQAIFASAARDRKMPETRAGRGAPDGVRALKVLGDLVTAGVPA